MSTEQPLSDTMAGGSDDRDSSMGSSDALPAFNSDGVDLGLIRWFRKLTPAQRLETLQNFVDFVVEARNAREAGKVR